MYYIVYWDKVREIWQLTAVCEMKQQAEHIVDYVKNSIILPSVPVKIIYARYPVPYDVNDIMYFENGDKVQGHRLPYYKPY